MSRQSVLEKLWSAGMQVAYPALPAAQSAICIREVRIDVTGTEHVDPKWVSSRYHGGEAVVHTSARVRSSGYSLPCQSLACYALA